MQLASVPEISEKLVFDKSIIFDLNHYNLIVPNGITITDHADVTIRNGGTLANDPNQPTDVINVIGGATLRIQGIEMQAAGANGITLGKISSAGHLIVEGAYINAGEHAIFVAGDESTVVVEDGLFSSYDNAIIAGDGYPIVSNTEITINGGTFEGRSSSEGYLACGIYHPQNGTLTINGGDFTIYNGIGVLVRGGEVTINDCEIETTGTQSGKVVDNRTVSCSAVFIDGAANYSSWTNSHTTIDGGTYTTDTEASPVVITVPEGEDAHDRLSITGGLFNGESTINPF